MTHESDQSSEAARGAASKPVLEAGQIIAGKYQIESMLGSGGMGAVYVARNLRTRKTWALKVLHPDLSRRADILQRFMSEAQAAGLIGHPGIVEIIDQDSDGNLNFLVMSKLEGEELATRIERAHPLPVPFVLRVVADVADAIDAAHRAKIIHRDLKPANVFLAKKNGREDVVQILDFGIAKLMDENSVAQPLTNTRDIYGTPHYMSPEQLRSAKEVDERTDIYAIGVILYEALAGRRPFQAETLTDLVVRIMTEEPTPLKSLRPEVPDALVAIIKTAMARDRAARFQTAAELRDALKACSGAVLGRAEAFANTFSTNQTLPASTSRVSSPLAASSVSPKRRATVFGAIATVAVGGAAAASFLLTRHPGRDRVPPANTPPPVVQASGSGPDALATPPPAPNAPQPRIEQPHTGEIRISEGTKAASRLLKASTRTPKPHPPSPGSHLDADLPPLKPR